MLSARDIGFLLCGVGAGLTAANLVVYFTTCRACRALFKGGDDQIKLFFSSFKEHSNECIDTLLSKLSSPTSTSKAKTIVEQALTLLYEKDMKGEAKTIMELWNSSMPTEYGIY